MGLRNPDVGTYILYELWDSSREGTLKYHFLKNANYNVNN